MYNKCRRLKASFANSLRLRLHNDENEEERTLIYNYLTGNLLHFVGLQHTTQQRDGNADHVGDWEGSRGDARSKHHARRYHNYSPQRDLLLARFLRLIPFSDLKPDNILLNWDPQMPDGRAKSQQSHLVGFGQLFGEGRVGQPAYSGIPRFALRKY